MNSLLTQGIKAALNKSGIKYSSNVLALACAVLCGFFGTLIYYVLTGLKIGPVTFLFAVLMLIAVWLGSMVGYDKVTQLVKQIGGVK